MPKCLLLLVLLLAGCVPVPPVQPSVSPLAAPARIAAQRAYLPMVAMTPTLSGKKGVAGGPCAIVEHVGAIWYYGWSFVGADCTTKPAHYESSMIWYVPMIRGLETLVAAAEPETGKRRLRVVLGPNEPDRSDQGDMTVAETVFLVRWMALHYVPIGWQIISPAMSMRSLYLEQVYAEYVRQYAEPPPWQALNVHCYRPTAADCIGDISYYIDLARRWRIPGGVWVTEFAFLPCWAGKGSDLANMLYALQQAELLARWLEATPEIRAYAWYVSEDTGLADWDIWPGLTCRTRLYDPTARHYTTFGEWYAGTPWREAEFAAFLARVATEDFIH